MRSKEQIAKNKEQLTAELKQWNRTRFGVDDLVEIVLYLQDELVDQDARYDALKAELTKTNRQAGAAKARLLK